MADSVPHKPIGPWTILRLLSDDGGNSVVWVARKDANDPLCALKVLTAKKAQDESYRRFQAEVEILERLQGKPGILPFIAANLELPHAWLAMPLAQPIRAALGTSPALEAVVTAVAALADTFVGLAAEGIYHRDIKPNNLYSYNQQWVIGDFGLVTFPDKAAVTGSTRQVGPRNFTAPEMITAPHTAHAGPADVFSLAKTLWVLATGQTWPPPGPQRIDDPSAALRSYIEHPRIYLLERLIEQATQNTPQGRPAMAELAAELHTWLQLLQPPILNDLNIERLRYQLDTVMAPRVQAEQRFQAQLTAAHQFMAQYVNYNEPLEQTIRGVARDESAFSQGRGAVADMFSENFKVPGRELILSNSVHWEVRSGVPMTNPLTLRAEIGTALYTNEVTRMAAGYVIRGGKQPHDDVVWQEQREAPLESAQELQAMREISQNLQDNFQGAYDELLKRITVSLSEPNGR